MKTYCLQTMRRGIMFRKERCSREAGEEGKLAIIKSLIMLDRKRGAWGALVKIDQNRSKL